MSWAARNLYLRNLATCPDIMQKQLSLRKIAPYKKEWGNFFSNDVQNRGFSIKNKAESTWLLDYGKRNRIYLDIHVNEEDMWLVPKFRNHPFFLTMFFIGLGAGFLIFLGIMFLLFNLSGFSSIPWLFMIFFIFIIFIFTIVTIGVVLSNRGRVTMQGIPHYSSVLMELYQAARYAEQKVVNQYFSQDHSSQDSQTYCPQCRKAMDPAWSTCPFCGTSLSYKTH